MTPHEWIRSVAPSGGSWASSEGARRAFSANRSRDTRPELAFRRAAHRLGLRYRVDGRPIPAIRHRADLVFRRARVGVFIDGCFWHGCPEHYRLPRVHPEYWQVKITGNQARDAAIDEFLATQGWLSVRVWEHEDMPAAALHLAVLVRARSQAGAGGGR